MNILVFSDDWGRHPSSCQHIFSHFFDFEEIDRIFWINTIGTRPPRLDFLTLRRGLGKILQWGGLKPPARPQSPRLADPDGPCKTPEIRNPVMFPWFRKSLDRKINRYLLKKAIRAVVKDVTGPVIAVTTLPIVADVVGDGFPDSPISRWIYYCVDDWSQWPGSDSLTMEKMEKDLVRKADVIISAGVSLQQRISALGRASSLLTHGVDLAHWRPSSTKIVEMGAFLPLLKDAERPIYTFWGLIDERMDINFVKQLADDIPQGTIIMAGPCAAASRLSQLAHPQILTPGALTYSQLPILAACSDVLIMPYLDIPVTQQMQPLKMTEYLATGKPAVVRRLPACEAWADAMDLVETPEQFSKVAQLRATEGIPAAQKTARLRLEQESWGEKARQFKEIILRHD